MEVGRARHEVGLAVDLRENAPRVIGGDLVRDEALVRAPAGFLLRAGEPALAQNRRRLVEVAVRVGQRVLALHHPRARLVAELLHIGGSNRRHNHWCVGA